MSNKEASYDVKQMSSLPGVMSCVMTHKVTSSQADFKWLGPKLNEEWPKIISFFEWTYDTMKSESQVRLYVNGRTQQWKAWAFPQRARTGMSATELVESDEGYGRTREQRAMFSDVEGWEYWGTVHHHCSASAFQSGADLANERFCDGLHITVGGMDKKFHDLHYRLYKCGIELKQVNLSEFWDVGNVISTIPAQVQMLLRPDWLEQITRIQMGAAPEKWEFPEIWRENVIDVTPKQVMVTDNVPVTSYVGSFGDYRTFADRSDRPWPSDFKKAMSDLVEWLPLKQKEDPTVDAVWVMDRLENMSQYLDADDLEILDICIRSECALENLHQHLFEYVSGPHTPEKAAKPGKQRKDNKHWAEPEFNGYF